MSHNLNVTNGKTSMVYCGETPWHGLGQRVDEAMTAQVAMEKAGLDYRVSKYPVGAQLSAGIWTHAPKRHMATVREDTKQVLGVVTESYEIIQNSTCFDFLDSLVTDGVMKYHTAGALGRGEIIWLLAKLEGQTRVVEDDVLDHYILLANRHDGRGALHLQYTPTRVVCNNTLSWALYRGRKSQYRMTIQHRGDVMQRQNEARDVLGLVMHAQAQGTEEARLMSQKVMTADDLNWYFESLYPSKEEVKADHQRKIREALIELTFTGRGTEIPGVAGTLWAAYNAVTDYEDHYRKPRGRSFSPAQHRFKSTMMDTGLSRKQEAWNLARRAVGVTS